MTNYSDVSDVSIGCTETQVVVQASYEISGS